MPLAPICRQEAVHRHRLEKRAEPRGIGSDVRRHRLSASVREVLVRMARPVGLRAGGKMSRDLREVAVQLDTGLLVQLSLRLRRRLMIAASGIGWLHQRSLLQRRFIFLSQVFKPIGRKAARISIAVRGSAGTFAGFTNVSTSGNGARRGNPAALTRSKSALAAMPTLRRCSTRSEEH